MNNVNNHSYYGQNQMYNNYGNYPMQSHQNHYQHGQPQPQPQSQPPMQPYYNQRPVQNAQAPQMQYQPPDQNEMYKSQSRIPYPSQSMPPPQPSHNQMQHVQQVQHSHMNSNQSMQAPYQEPRYDYQQPNPPQEQYAANRFVTFIYIFFCPNIFFFINFKQFNLTISVKIITIRINHRNRNNNNSNRNIFQTIQ